MSENIFLKNISPQRRFLFYIKNIRKLMNNNHNDNQTWLFVATSQDETNNFSVRVEGDVDETDVITNTVSPVEQDLIPTNWFCQR